MLPWWNLSYRYIKLREQVLPTYATKNWIDYPKSPVTASHHPALLPVYMIKTFIYSRPLGSSVIVSHHPALLPVYIIKTFIYLFKTLRIFSYCVSSPSIIASLYDQDIYLFKTLRIFSYCVSSPSIIGSASLIRTFTYYPESLNTVSWHPGLSSSYTSVQLHPVPSITDKIALL